MYISFISLVYQFYFCIVVPIGSFIRVSWLVILDELLIFHVNGAQIMLIWFVAAKSSIEPIFWVYIKIHAIESIWT